MKGVQDEDDAKVLAALGEKPGATARWLATTLWGGTGKTSSPSRNRIARSLSRLREAGKIRSETVQRSDRSHEFHWYLVAACEVAS